MNNRDLGVWTSDECALVLIDYQKVINWYFTEVPKVTDDVGVAEAELLRAQGQAAV